MDTEKLREAISDDITRWTSSPFCVVATIGTTSTTSVDPVEKIADICERNNIFLHVDAAYAGSAAIVPEFQHYLKVGNAPIQSLRIRTNGFSRRLICRFLYVKDLDLLKQTFSLVPEYLKVTETVTNQMDYGIQLGRRFRSLKLWFVMRYFGQEGLITEFANIVVWRELFANWVEDIDDFEILAPVPFALVCFRACPKDVRRFRCFERKNYE